MHIYLQFNLRTGSSYSCYAKTTMQDLLEDKQENKHINADIQKPSLYSVTMGVCTNGVSETVLHVILINWLLNLKSSFW